MPPSRRSPFLLVLLTMGGLQALAMVGYAFATLVVAFRGIHTSVTSVALLSALVLAWAVGLVAALAAVDRGQRAGRAPVVLTELILLLAVGLPLAQGSDRVLGVLVAASAVVALVGIFSRPVTQSLVR